MEFLKGDVRENVKKALQSLGGPVKMVAFTQEVNCETCGAAETLLREVADLSDKIELIIHNPQLEPEVARKYGVDKVPAVVLEGPAGARVRFFGIPAGYEFASLLAAIRDTAAGKTDLSAAVQEKFDDLPGPIHIQVFVTPTCPHCPGAVRTGHKLAVDHSNVTADMVETQEFPELADRYGVHGVPKIVINEREAFVGALPEADFAEAVAEAARRTTVEAKA
jgi:glutaredoxin-like protein